MTVLFVISTIIFFLGLDWIIQRLKRGKETDAVPAARPAVIPYPLRTPEGIFFAKSHTWLNLFPSGRVRLGVDDFVGSLMEHPKITFLKRTGEQVEKGDPLLLIEESEHRLTVRAPLSGEILALNSDLEKSPEHMREKLFSEGWAYTIRPRSLQDLRDMLVGAETRSWMLDEFRKLRELLTGTVCGECAPAHIQDGGAPEPSTLKQLDPGKWKKLEDAFLQVR